MKRKIISSALVVFILSVSINGTVPVSAQSDPLNDNDLNIMHELTFDEGDTLSEIRVKSSFDYNLGSGSITITDGYSGNAALFASGATDSTLADTNTTMNIWASYGGLVVFEGYFKFPDKNMGHSLLHVNANLESGGTGWVCGFTTESYKSLLTTKYRLKSMTGTALCDIDTDTWYHLEEVIDTDEDKVYYYVNGTLLAENALRSAVTTTARTLVKVPAGSSSVSVYFDSCTVRTTSESIFDAIELEPALSSRPDAAQIGADFSAEGVHPRIAASQTDFETIKTEISDGDKALWYKWLILRAEDILTHQTLKYELRDGVRLLAVASELEDRMTTLGMAYRLTGDSRYSDKAYTDLAAVAGFSDWHPSHAIDVGVMATGYAIGYDWMYDAFDEDQRQVLEDGVKSIGLDMIRSSYMSTSGEMSDAACTENNHNAINNGGAILLAAAFYDIYPAECRYIISNAVRGLEQMLVNYSDDGSWYEGAAYGAVNVNYLSYAFATLEKSFGTVYELDTRTAGLAHAGEYLKNMVSQVGSFNYADADFDEGEFFCAYLDGHFGCGTACRLIKNGVCSEPGESLAWALLYSDSESDYDAPLSKLYETDDVLLLRGSGENGTFVGIKGGETVKDHSHLDEGSFVFDSQGVRWAVDLGKDDYNLDGYFDTSGPRWNIFRMRAQAHNTIIVNPDSSPEYTLGASAEITDFEETDNGAAAKLDMGEVLSEHTENAERAFCLTDGRESLVIRDELSVADDSTIYWLMYTEADADIDGDRVILSDKTDPSKKLTVDFLCGTEHEIIYEAAEPFCGAPTVEGQAENDGFYRLALKTTASKDAAITVKLTPINVCGSDVSDYDIPISNWSADMAAAAGMELACTAESPDYTTKKTWQNITFDENADITNPNKSALNTQTAYKKSSGGMSFDWTMTPSSSSVGVGYSDLAVVSDNGTDDPADTVNTSRVMTLISGAGSVYTELAGMESVLTERTDSASGGFTEGIVKYEVSVKFPDFSSDKTVLTLRYDDDSGNSGCWLPAFFTAGGRDDGYLTLNDAKEEYLAPLEKNRWYNFKIYVDLDNDICSYWLDDEYIGERTISAGIDNLQRAQIKVAYSADVVSELKIDDLKVETLERSDAELRCYGGAGISRTAARSNNGAVLLAADYSDSGQLLKTELYSVGADLQIYDRTPADGAARTKLFMWNSVETAVPILAVTEITDE